MGALSFLIGSYVTEGVRREYRYGSKFDAGWVLLLILLGLWDAAHAAYRAVGHLLNYFI